MILASSATCYGYDGEEVACELARTGGDAAMWGIAGVIMVLVALTILWGLHVSRMPADTTEID